jgi:hypothetical protein
MAIVLRVTQGSDCHYPGSPWDQDDHATAGTRLYQGVDHGLSSTCWFTECWLDAQERHTGMASPAGTMHDEKTKSTGTCGNILRPTTLN